MDKITSNKIERLLHSIGYYELEFQHLMKTNDGKTMYEYIGWINNGEYIVIPSDELKKLGFPHWLK